MSPYKHALEDLGGSSVTIDRDGAPTLHGEVCEIGDNGCMIATDGPNEESSLFIFVAYKHIRGVGRTTWDPNKIGK